MDYKIGAKAFNFVVGFGNVEVFLQAITADGTDSTYRKDGYNKFTVVELTSPYQATARLCGMAWTAVNPEK